jgi:excinuclease UvrABC nuclease subunit
MTDWTAQFDAHAGVYPPIDDQVLAQVPAKRGVLLLLGEDDRPLMLLTAADLRGRLRGRLAAPAEERTPSRRVDWRQITRKVCWKLTDSHFETDLHYLDLARAIWPEGFTKLLAWRLGRFVHVDPAARVPHFAKVNRLLPPPGLCLGPFLSAKSAQGFIDILEDGFDLCRDVRRLGQSPRARPCAYRQMGRCSGVCDGTIDMATYRVAVARAAAFAAGERSGHLQELRERMKQAAAELRFEQAAGLKGHLDRLAGLDAPAYAQVAPGEAFQFVLVQRGRRKAAKVFLVDRGLIVAADPLTWPLKGEEISALLARMAALVGQAQAAGRYDPWRVALVASYLLAGPQRRGVIVRWRTDLTAEALAEAVTGGRESLGLARVSSGGAEAAPSAQAPTSL